MLTEDILRKMWPNGDRRVPNLVHGMAAAAPSVFAKYGIASDLVIAHMMAQFSHECGAGLEMTENVNYTAERAAQVWPLRGNDNAAYRHFADAADCYKKCGSYPGDKDFPRKLINLVYGTRMGNRPGTNDGWMFIGRGLSQVTGQDGYAALTNKTGLPLLTDPTLVNASVNALECGVADFILCGCLPYALRDDVEGVTLHLNGGYVGLRERQEWLARWRTALKGSPPVPVPSLGQPQAPSGVEKKHVAVGTVVAAGGAAATAAHQAGYSHGVVAAIVVGCLLLAVAAYAALHKRGG